MAYGESGIPHHEVPGLGGAHEIRGRATGGVGHGMSYANSGVGHSMSWGDPGHLVSNPEPRLWAKEGKGGRWPIHETSGQAGLGRKEGGKRGDGSLGKEKPRRVEPTGRGGGDWDLLAVTSKGGKD